MRSLLEPLFPQHTGAQVAVLTACLRHGEKGPALSHVLSHSTGKRRGGSEMFP
jgi:hypothetical protein